MGSVIRESLKVTLGLNETPSTATFTLKPGSTAPPLYAPVEIGLGSLDHSTFFYGSVIRRKFRAISAAHDPFIDVFCLDDLWLFDRLLVNRSWFGWTISDIAIDVIGSFTSGFSSAMVQTISLVVPEFITADERPTAVLRRLVSLAGGGGFYVAARIVHLFDSAGELGPSAPTAPVTITNTLSTFLHPTLDAWQREDEGRELRTRTIVYGRSTVTLLAIPAGSQGLFGNATLSVIPIIYAQFFAPAFVAQPVQARVGAQVLTYFAKNGVSGVEDRPYAVVTADVAIGDTSIAVTSSGMIWAEGMSLGGVTYTYVVLHHTSDDQANVFIGRVSASATTMIDLIPATGFGSVKTAIPAGTLVYLLDALWTTDALDFDYDVGTTVTVRTVVDDVTAQGLIAAAEGGDGVHEYPITQPKETSYAEDEGLGQADLDAFKAGLPLNTWMTRDLNARPGATQAWALTGANVYTDSQTITRVALDFPVENAPPFRQCAASNVKLEQFVDMLRGPRG